MFTLRKISGEGIEMNFSLGASYTLVTKEHNPKEFAETSLIFWKKKNPENTYGFVSDENGKIFPLYIGQFNCIMTSGGRTFANISLK